MSSSSNKRPSPTTPPAHSTVILLLGDIADTTWRMFVPTIGGALLGWWADTTWQTGPWLAIIGVVLGAFVTAGLIKQQLNKVNNDK